MTPQEVRRAIKKKMNEVKRKKVFTKALQVVRALGNLDHIDRGCYTETTGKVHIKVNDALLYIGQGCQGQFMQDKTLLIRFGGIEVFKAHETSFPEKEDPNRLVKIGTSIVYVELYTSGDWVKYLNVQKLKKVLDKNARFVAVRQRSKKETPFTGRTDPLNEREIRLAASLGVVV